MEKRSWKVDSAPPLNTNFNQFLIYKFPNLDEKMSEATCYAKVIHQNILQATTLLLFAAVILNSMFGRET